VTDEQYNRVLAAARKFQANGGKITTDQFGAVYNQNDGWFAEAGCACALGALVVCKQPALAGTCIMQAANILDCAMDDLWTFTEAFDGASYANDDPWFQAGRRMRKELGL